jgi:hypothetical protein
MVALMTPNDQKLSHVAGNGKPELFSCHMPLVTYTFPALAPATG